MIIANGVLTDLMRNKDGRMGGSSIIDGSVRSGHIRIFPRTFPPPGQFPLPHGVGHFPPSTTTTMRQATI